MEFRKFKQMLTDNFNEVTKDVNRLFEVDVDNEFLWNLYLDSFPEGTNEIFRERREYDCSCCRHFVRDIGNVVVIKDNKVTTIWDFDTSSTTFQPVVDALSTYVRSKAVANIHFSKFNKIGVDKNFEKLESGKILEWTHLYLELPNKFVSKTSRSEGDIKGDYRDTKNVFKRSLDEISENSVVTVLELISQNSLYKGEEWESVLTEFLKHKRDYLKLQTREEENNYAWEQSVKVGAVVGRIRNHSMGTLLVNISEEMELDLAVSKYESIVAPENYKRSKPVFTKRMLEEARKTIEELGYTDSLARRYATLDDITVNNILFSNKDSAKRIVGLDIFDEMASDVAISPKQYSKVEEVTIEDFINKILPTAKEVELLLENSHAPNMVSLIAPQNKDSKSMFKWDNAFGWAYSGNITDSSMKQRVKSAGGNVEGELRFSIQWNDGDTHDRNDLDAHCIEPRGNEIFFGRKNNYKTTGVLDVDIMQPTRDVPAVENITWSNRGKMEEGIYTFFVHNYSNRGGRDGFKAEIEFDGETYSFEYNKEVRQGEKVLVALVTLDKDGSFSIKEKISSTTSSKEIWGLKTNQFIPVSTVLFSPNYWDKQDKIGNKHYFFMLKDCLNTERPNSFFNEFLKEDLITHRKVFEALGSRTRVEDNFDQLSGVGFSSTQRNEVIVKVKGAIERVVRIKL